MTSKKTTMVAATPALPQEIRSLLGKRPLLGGENPEMYDALFARVAKAVGAVDVIDYIYVKDVVDLTWEIERTRWFQSVMIDSERRRTIEHLLEPGLPLSIPTSTITPQSNAASREARSYLAGDSKAKAKVTAAIARHGLDDDSIAAEAFGKELPRLEITGRILAAAESRRDKVFREIDRRRESREHRRQRFLGAEKGKGPQLLESAPARSDEAKTELRQELPKKKDAA